MPSANYRRCASLILPVVTAVLIAGCPPSGGGGGGGAGEGSAALHAFASGEELLSYFRQQVLAQSNANRNANLFGGSVEIAPVAGAAATPDAVPAGTATGDETSGSSSYSTTNIQEEGVDESDVFKSDGVNFYIAKGKTLRIVRATPAAEMEEIAKIAFDQEVESLYLVGDKALVLLQTYGYVYGGPMPMSMRTQTADAMMWPPYYANASVSVAEVDISDPAAATITKQVQFDGSLVTSRVTNERLILVLTIAPPVPDNPTISSLGGLTLDNVLPKMHDNAGLESPMIPPENWYHPVSPDGYFTTAVMTLDVADIASVIGSVAVMANAGTIYASPAALYITNTDYTLDNQYRETTAIHKLAFSADGVAEYAASGTVPGRLLNQFSLSELDGNLRLATHISNFGGWMETGSGGVAVPDATVANDGQAQSSDAATGSAGSSTGVVEPGTGVSGTSASPGDPHNAVYVLQENDGVLETVGSLEGIAPNENLYAARFIGTRGFLVTFQQIDPLSVLDLSDPTDPKLVGQLELPGYSDYLHPFGDNLLIGVGRSTRTSPWGGVVRDAIQLSLFDVSDLSNPTLVQRIEVGGYGSESDVSYTHKAFTFLPDRGLLAIPGVLLSDQGDPWTAYSYLPEFDGILCYHVDATGSTALGRVSSVIYDELGFTQWRRAAVIEDTVYSVTPAGLRAADLNAFDTSTELVLTPNTEEVGTGGGQSSPGSPGEATPAAPPA